MMASSRRQLRKKISGLLKRPKSNSDDLSNSSTPTSIISLPFSTSSFESFPSPVFIRKSYLTPNTSPYASSPVESFFSHDDDGFVILDPKIKEFKKLEIPRPRSRTEGDKMATDLLVPRVAGQGVRIRQIQDAKNMNQVIVDRCKKKGLEIPDYEFLELIGKGTYGRVYKCRDRRSQSLCAVKMIEVDETDYSGPSSMREDAINEFIRETSILQSLKDNRVKNVNIIYDAFSIDSWLWIITEYCPGGSLATLMKENKRPTYPGLEEDLIIPIAREVAVALKYVHEAGIIHRDIKCGNILVTEDGRLQLCDFGISNVLENEVSKRSTIIGTPHWMAPELVAHLGSSFESVRYGTEIDCWAFGCAVYEMATGHPPNARIEPQDLGVALHRHAPKLDGNFSRELKDFISFVLQENPSKRPSAAQIVNHHFIKETELTHPTESVRKLIERFALWEGEGGQRNSLFNAWGAGGSGPTDSNFMSPTASDNSEWNFSTTLEFDRRISMGLDPFAGSKGKSGYEKVIEEARIKRGGDKMKGIFDVTENPYGTPDLRGSDLRFRNLSNPPHTAANRTTLIDLDAVIPGLEEGPNLDLDSAPTIRARRFFNDQDEYEDDDGDDHHPPHGDTFVKRATKEWTFPSMDADDTGRNPNRKTKDWKFPSMIPEIEDNTQTSRKITKEAYRDTRDWTFPTEWPSDQERDTKPTAVKPPLVTTKTAPSSYSFSSSLASSPDRGSIIDLDSALTVSGPLNSRPTTADAFATSQARNGDMFYLEPEYGQRDDLSSNNRGSMHIKSQSEPSANYPNNPGQIDESMQLLGVDSSHNRASSVTSASDVNRLSGQPGMYGNQIPSVGNIKPPTPWDPYSTDMPPDDMMAAAVTTSTNAMSPPPPAWQQPSYQQPYSQSAMYSRSNSSSLRKKPHARGKLSTSSGITTTSDDSHGSGGGVGATLRPSQSQSTKYSMYSFNNITVGSNASMPSGVTMGSRNLKPRDILRMPKDPNKAVLFGTDGKAMEVELATMYEELAAQADVMVSLLASLAEDDLEVIDGSPVDEGNMFGGTLKTNSNGQGIGEAV